MSLFMYFDRLEDYTVIVTMFDRLRRATVNASFSIIDNAARD